MVWALGRSRSFGVYLDAKQVALAILAARSTKGNQGHQASGFLGWRHLR